MTTLSKTRMVVGVIAMSALFMWLMPYGSFSPQESGFYLSILTAITIVIGVAGGFKLFGARKQ